MCNNENQAINNNCFLSFMINLNLPIGVSPEMTLHVESKVNCLIEGSEPVGDRVGKIMMIFPGFGMVFVGVNLIV